jgi:aminoglycoside phosphotransferase (APT) family kinase protein
VRGATPTADVAPALLALLRHELHAPDLAYAEPPRAVGGGYDTRIFAFRLQEAPAPWAGPLVLRLLHPAQDPLRALRERATQGALGALGYPVPRVLAACGERAPLGAGFLVMERLPGRPLLEARRPGLGRTLAEAQARLHALDPEPLRQALDDEGRAAGGGFDRTAVGFEGHLAALDRRIGQAGLTGLIAGMRWLLERRPTAATPVICHGDFHPQNLLAVGGRVTGVLDWPNVVVAPAEYDVASTLVILTATPVALLPVPAVLRPLIAALRRMLAARYLAVYRGLRPLDAASLPYCEAAACMRGLVRVGEARAAGGAAAQNPLDASSFGERLATRFARVSGVAVALPPRPG